MYIFLLYSLTSTTLNFYCCWWFFSKLLDWIITDKSFILGNWQFDSSLFFLFNFIFFFAFGPNNEVSDGDCSNDKYDFFMTLIKFFRFINIRFYMLDTFINMRFSNSSYITKEIFHLISDVDSCLCHFWLKTLLHFGI